ncbi:SAM-dependent methyltransferase [Nocardia sp. CA2R105]|uniref:SAM-dependent methyltransferase n=1 Tax=Nocardia coffeae TaxID=2873381 RepID=UPI001CA60FCA|nr:SAM-dependent methyltransferase [Nocardia coffeae]MBY8855466.1 SAM-dependent methyltransferase [Nocardia coffeae]
MSDKRPAPEGIDPTKPNTARMFDYLLGGKDNYKADREAALRLLEIAPETRTLAWFSRRFLTGAAELAAQAGVRQFLDIGAGIPTSPSVYETVSAVDPDVRVASVDFDPVVYRHTDAMVGSTPAVTAMLGDFRHPDDLIERLRTEAGIDFDRPVALLLVGILHFVMDDERPAELIARFREVMAPGSYLVFTHGSTDSDDELIGRTARATDGTTAQCAYRSRSEVEKLFDGFEMLDPGVAPIQQWIGNDLPPTTLVMLGGVCHIPAG